MSDYIIYNGELCHYGVVGMRWGHRKSQKYANKAARYETKAAKYEAKAKSKAAKAANYKFKSAQKARESEFQGRQVDIGNARSKGAKIATNILAGAFANRTYNSVMAAGGSKTAARLTTALVGTAGPLGHIVVSELYAKRA